MTHATRELGERLRGARHVLVLTGSGVSAASGIPTFRSAGTGLWARYRPEELATREAFAREPELVWQWFGNVCETLPRLMEALGQPPTRSAPGPRR